jgi:hypothetical protein
VRAPLVAFTAAAAALCLPSAAFGHVGASAPVATNFSARIAGVSPPSRAFEARVVDGDGMLWLRAAAGSTIVVRGATGEPMLRFDAAGVFVDLASPTAWSDRIVRTGAAHGWHRLTSGHVYAWHEHRLHVREALARGVRTPESLGGWSVPLLVDGRPHVLHGVLEYRPAGSPWPWVGLVAALAAAVTAGGLRNRLRTVAVAAALPACVLVWIVRVARELYGRPVVGASSYAAVAGTCVVGAALLYGLSRRDSAVRVFTALLVGFGSLYQAATTFAVLTHATALTLLPSTFARALVATLLGLGIAALALAVVDQLRSVERDALGFGVLEEAA